MNILGLFGNFSKVGKGVSKYDDDDRSPVQMYFLVFFRRISKFFTLNFTFLIPLLLTAIGIAILYFLPVTKYNFYIATETASVEVALWNRYVLPLPLILLSPFWGGVMVVARRLSQQEYSFVWPEYWSGVKANFGQFLCNGIVVYLIYALVSFSFIYYSAYIGGTVLYYFIYVILIIVTMLVGLSQMYVSLLIVSVELPMRQIYKNAFIFSILGIKKNLLYLLVLVLLAVLSLTHFLVLIILPSMILCSFLAYSNAYICYPVIKKYIVEPYNNPQGNTVNVPQIENLTPEAKIWDFDDEDEQVFNDV